METKNGKFFPIYLDSVNEKVLVVGGGAIGSRRLKTIAKFDFDITLISPEYDASLEELISSERITYIDREFQDSDITKDLFMVLACTDKREINEQIGNISRDLDIFVSVADSRHEGNFIYPGVSTFENMVIGVCGDGTDHKKTKKILNQIKDIFE